MCLLHRYAGAKHTLFRLPYGRNPGAKECKSFIKAHEAAALGQHELEG